MTTQPQTDHARARLCSWTSRKWTLERLLGVGGTASVYAARHRNGARAAIKVLHRELADDVDLRRRFMREALIANRVDHPAVVRVLDDEEDEGEPFLVMELVEGTTLSDVTAFAPLDAPELLDVAEQLLDALVVAHGEGIIHRDLKPQNLMIDRRGRLRILDFGIARVLDDDAVRTLFTSMGAIWGTLEFMAPEQLVGSCPAGPRTDVYAVGATLFALASRQFVQDAPDTRKRVLAAVSTPARSLASVRHRLSPGIVALVDRATRQSPAERWPSAAEMLHEVRRLRHAERAAHWGGRVGSSRDPASTTGSTRAFEALRSTGTRSYVAVAEPKPSPAHVKTRPIEPIVVPSSRAEEPTITVEAVEELDEIEATTPTGSLRAIAISTRPPPAPVSTPVLPAREAPRWSRRVLVPLAIVAVSIAGATSLRRSPAPPAHAAVRPAPPAKPAPIVVSATATAKVEVAPPPPVAPTAPVVVPSASVAVAVATPKRVVIPKKTAPVDSVAVPTGYKGWADEPY